MGRLLIDVQFQDDDGNPLSGGLMNFYETGTLTRKNTYLEEAMSTLNANPVVMDANGRMADGVWYTGAAKIVITDSAGVIVPNGTFDPVYTDTGGGGGGSGFEDYSASETYNEGDIVTSSNRWYQSLGDDNTNNAVTNTTYWSEMRPIYIWNTNDTYKEDDFVYYSALLYKSLADSNTGNNPITSITNWEPLAYQFRHNDEGTITTGQTVTLDLLQYNRFTITKDTGADITVAFSNEPASAKDYVFDIKLINGASSTTTITWPASVKWPFNVEPEWGSGTDVVTFIKYPGETVYHGSLYTASSA